MKQKISKIFNIGLPLLLGVFLIYYAYQQFTAQQIHEIGVQFKNADYKYIYLASFFSVLSLWARAYRWKYALRFMGYDSGTFTNFMALSVGYLMNLTVPRSGEISRALVLQKYKKVPFDKIFGTIISERIIDLFCLLLCVFTALILQYDILKEFLLNYVPVKKLFGLGVFLVLTIIAFTLIFKFSRWKAVVYVKNKIKGLTEGVQSIFRMPYRTGFLFFTLLIWGGYIATFYFGTFALAETSALTFPVVMSAFVAGSFAISFTNGGIGAFPLIISELLLFYGVSTVSGTAFGWILWTTQTAIIVILGVFSLLFLPLISSKSAR
ncbi:lysylphosphatidylglycerol synthase transmembrane domain-containing protein [Myroides indicus]|uniref:Lysylphosphatidylglycerol synthase-like protein n=1 Tax=Myroides indicus TaxID=1323422 RepID=A0A4R7EXE6_9FLAO|nr:lysylphosphatidylglycerol synthase transmembrane domain-containing protein [Myroides indicus]TDS58182.1 hypothetical protein C8P70_11213 [Myroides indicus]